MISEIFFVVVGVFSLWFAKDSLNAALELLKEKRWKQAVPFFLLYMVLFIVGVRLIVLGYQ